MLAGALAIGLSLGTAHAQSAPTCSFEEGTRTLNVLVDGDPATLSLSASGAIKLNGSKCTGATTTTTDLIWVDGGELDDKVTVVDPNAFTPGATIESSGLSELELNFSLNEGGVDTVILTYTDEPEEIRFTGSGIDVGLDGDRDIALAVGVEIVEVKAKGGDDLIRASGFVSYDKIYLYGGQGNDTIFAASGGPSRLYGEDGDDELHGRGATTFHYGGPGNDLCVGSGGKDIFVADAGDDGDDGDDEYYGGSGRDTIDYSKRTNGVSVTPDDGLANDGEPGEADYVDEDVENLTAGAGDDVLIGTSERNTLTGNDGDDSLYGGPDLDKFYGGAGNDVIFNDDGITETVDCGPGTDDPQPSNDDFTNCELI